MDERCCPEQLWAAVLCPVGYKMVRQRPVGGYVQADVDACLNEAKSDACLCVACMRSIKTNTPYLGHAGSFLPR